MLTVIASDALPMAGSGSVAEYFMGNQVNGLYPRSAVLSLLKCLTVTFFWTFLPFAASVNQARSSLLPRAHASKRGIARTRCANLGVGNDSVATFNRSPAREGACDNARTAARTMEISS